MANASCAGSLLTPSQEFASARSAASFSSAVSGGGSAAALQLQRNALESLDAAEQMAELEMQKEALELEEKESRLLKAAP